MHLGTLFAAGILTLAGCWLSIVTICLICAELHIHSNAREPIGVHLSRIMTLFSFLSFRYHLCNIARLKENHRDRHFYYQGGPRPTLPVS
jgi:hypothetical protein